ncbi:uncharacterized protein LOC105390447 isoform X2 [Plutella xylostella]|uniref:uncharacterized protein LOC105390447 isoform X2 n=1 Tax=Plutella xylostella TaxID=51655 RepID=UPI002032B18D|nr:uncharacterized protein LOC105390447 isoform X2 [Plutella xylostella]
MNSNIICFRSNVLILFLSLLFLVNGSDFKCKNGHLRLVIDHDAGADDAMAIFIAALYEQRCQCRGPKLVAITTTHGNVDEPQAYNNTQRILGVLGRNVPIYRGANDSILINQPSDHFFGIDGLGDTEYGVHYEAIEAQPQVAANALIELSNKYKGPSESRPEFNVKADVEAYHIVAGSSNPDLVTFIPLSQVPKVTKEWREDVFGSIKSKPVEAMNAFERVVQTKNRPWGMLDPAAMALALGVPLEEVYDYSDNSVVVCGDSRGITTNVFGFKNESNIRILNTFDKDLYKKFLIDLFSEE